MFNFLFPRLTRAPSRGQALFDALTAVARQEHWYLTGQVPDTMDGRFRVLATLTALAAVRLESEGGDGDQLSVALTERFVEVMETEHREIGLGDPTLGRKVRKLVGSLARRVDLWRATVSEGGSWIEPTRQSLNQQNVEGAAVHQNATALQEFWSALKSCGVASLALGQIR